MTKGLDRKKGTENRGNMETKMINGNKEQGKKGKPNFGKEKNGMGIGRHRKMRDR
jgi:hypothetical protein